MPTKNGDIELNLPLSLTEETRKRFLRIRTVTYQKIVSNRALAISYALDALKKTQPENINAELIEEYADLMQSVARIILNQRGYRQAGEGIKKA
jgi:hypothetical protein